MRRLYASTRPRASRDALVHAPSSPRDTSLVCRRTEQRLGDAPITHTAAPPLLAAHPLRPTAVPVAVLARVPHLLAPPRKGSTPSKCKLGEQSLPYAARRRRICQRFGVTLVRTAHPPAVTPRRTAGAQYPTAGARHHHWYRHGRARSSYSHRHRTVGKRVRRHGVDRPQPGQ
ncbi:hypothetical protein B0H14DRAFT_2593393 [Mycena olivaceomarginata]|nr:hypothetical protein B0H14DRAFT_2593393 [Mycena olivaceomarginata]